MTATTSQASEARLRRWLPIAATWAVLLALMSVPVISSAQSLKVYLNASTGVTFASDRFTYVLTVANEGASDIFNVRAEVTISEFINSFGEQGADGINCVGTTCEPGEIGTWTVGTLTPGETRTTYFAVQVRGDAPETLIFNSVTAFGTGESDVSDDLEVQVDPTPLLRLDVAPGASPIAPGEQYKYVFTYGNIGTVAPSDVELRATIPEGTTFVSASDGAVAFSTFVAWPIGLLGPGSGGQVEMVVAADPDLANGDVVEILAALYPGVEDEYVVRFSKVVAVQSNNPLHLEYTVSQAALGSGLALSYVLTASNTGPVTLSSVNARVQIPQGISSFGESIAEDFNCVGSTCDPLEIASWSVGDLAPGESRSAYFRSSLSASAQPGDVFGSIVTANAIGANEVMAWQAVSLDPSPLLELSLAGDAGPAIPGNPYTYVLTYSNTGAATPTDVTLTLNLPEDTSFASATGGGTASGRRVTWDLGLIGPGAGGTVRATIISAGGLPLGTLLCADAELDADLAGEFEVHSSSCVPVSNGSFLKVEYAVSQTTVEKSGALTYTFLATNSGPVDLKNIEIRVLLPNEVSGVSDQSGQNWECVGTTCDANEVSSWSIGTLAPGEVRAIVHRTFVAPSARSGAILRSMYTAKSTATHETTGRFDVSVDPSPSMRLSLVPSESPVAPGQLYRYTIAYGNRGTTSPTDVILRLFVPNGVSIVDATDGATATADVITWDLGAVGPGAGGEVTAWVTMDETNAGEVLGAYAELDSHISSEYVLRSTANVSVQDEVPLRVVAAVDQAVVSPNGLITYNVVVSNVGAVDLNDVSVRVKLPDHLAGFADRTDEGFDCVGSTCDPNEVAVWSVPVLGPGESKNVIYKATVRNTAPQGEILRTAIVARASSTGDVLVYQNASVDVSPLMSLGVASNELPVDPSQNQVFTITYGNISGAPVTGVLRVAIPEGMSFVEASGDGYEYKNVVVWGTDLLGLGEGGQVTVTAQFDEVPAEGQVFEVFAELDPEDTTQYQLRSEAAFSVGSSSPLLLSVESDRLTVTSADSLRYELQVTNNGPVDLTGVSVRLNLPVGVESFSDAAGGLECVGTTCDPGELGIWSIATLAPGETQTLVVRTRVVVAPDLGDLIRLSVWGFATVANDVSGEVDVLIGEFHEQQTADAGDEFEMPTQFQARCLPSPLTTHAVFEIVMPREAEARLCVYDISGRLVETVFQGRLPVGAQEIPWDARSLRNGVYLYRIEFEGQAAQYGRVLKVK